MTKHKNILKRILKFMMFVDLPINRKFILFSIGVFFWFVVMFVINFSTSIYINKKTNQIVNQLIPHDAISHTITRKLQSLNSDLNYIINSDNIESINQKLDISRTRIMDIGSFVSALNYGGQVYDINRDNNKLIENYSVHSLKEYSTDSQYPDNMVPLIKSLNSLIQKIGITKTAIITNNQTDQGELPEMINDFKQIISESSRLSTEFSSRTSELYAVNSSQIKSIMKLAIYLFVAALLIVPVLLIVFTISISKSITVPVKSITEQIIALSEGRADFSKDIVVRSKDEIGVLTEEFNYLMDEIEEMTAYKKLIEEDYSLEDVYSRLGSVFTDKFAIDNFIIYEVNNSQNKMKAVYPLKNH